MAVERVFLGWDRPAVVKVREYLLPQELYGPVDLARDLIVVPTTQAGRRLREVLALHCASRKTALLSPRVATPKFFLYAEDESGKMASPLETVAVWTDVLTKVDLSHYSGLYPARTPSPDFTWALHTGEMIQTLRETLADGGYRITDVNRDFGHQLEEKDRWEDLANLETAYLDRMAALGLSDPFESMLRYAENPKPPKGIERVVLAAVPDPTPLVVRVLERLDKQVPITVLVHAPESLADCFDGWGRPLSSRWQERLIDIPDADSSIILAASPRSQSRQVLELIAREAGQYGPADVAVGVPDSEVTPFLATDLIDKGLVPFDPAGKPVNGHPLCQLIQSFQSLVSGGTYRAFSAFLRHADFLEFLEKEQRLSPRRVLQEMDEYQNAHLPQGLGDIERTLLPGAGDSVRTEFPNLAKAVACMMEWVRDFRARPESLIPTHLNEQVHVDRVLRSLLQAVYEVHELSPGDADDVEFAAVAEVIDEALRQLSSGSLAGVAVDRDNALELLLWSLGRQLYNPEPEKAIIDLEGWLELPWNDAPLLIVTGMNDSVVPGGRLSDIFLPDTLRKLLILRCDADRLARDAYLMTALVESRRQEGRACFIAGKTGSSGDVLKPSRLLFRCTDAELPRRAERLFGSPVEARADCPSSITFPLDASPPPDLSAGKLDRARISVTAFRDYLACPFRFYLKHVLGMEEIDDQKVELDARDFGSLVHDVLHAMAQNSEMRRCRSADQLQDFLCARATDWAAARFGPSPPLQIEIQLESARQRLRETARVQAALISEDWEIIHSELEIEGELEGFLVRGKVDRLDRHRRTGRIRVIDYKTSENAQRPEESHLGSIPRDQELPGYMMVDICGSEKRWIDLQLPLYGILLSSHPGLEGPFDLGYFNLPRALPETGVVIWEGVTPSLLEAAAACARGVISDIRGRRFWPPSTRVRYEDFGKLFPAEPPECIDVESFEAFIRGEEA